VNLFAVARANPRTTMAGLAGFLSLVAGALGTYQGHQWWPLLLGAMAKAGADLIAHLLAADAKESP
jgi:hypothetical protein